MHSDNFPELFLFFSLVFLCLSWFFGQTARDTEEWSDGWMVRWTVGQTVARTVGRTDGNRKVLLKLFRQQQTFSIDSPKRQANDRKL